jgi:uncharacterized protein (DUF2236 family)
MQSSRRREDWGFFGPTSPTWKVWSSPTALVAFVRSVVVESFDPFLAAAVHEQNGVRSNPTGRLDRTLTYFLTVACGDARSALRASDIVRRVHDRARGVEPISGLPYSANDPASQLWIHVTGWHSNLLAFERFGPGPLSPDEELRYWAECARAAELQSCDPREVPRSRAEVRAYYARVRPRLCMSEHARALVHYFLEPAPSWTEGPPSRLVAAAAVSTMPRWMRELAGVSQSAVTDALVRPLARSLVSLARRPRAMIAIAEHLAPSAVPLVTDLARKEAPVVDEVLTIASARERCQREPSARERTAVAPC